MMILMNRWSTRRVTIMEHHADHDHLLHHARQRFPRAKIVITYTNDEIILIQVDDRRFLFEIGSDDDAYVFSDGLEVFQIPLMDSPPEDF